MALGREHAYTNAFYWLPDEMAELCVKALDAGIETEYVRALVQKRNLFPASPPLACEGWPWPVKIFTLGRFSLVKDGKNLQFSKKAQQKPLFMLKALIAFGGRDVRDDKIADALWHDADADTAHMSFETTLHRLRKLIGNENAVKLKEGRLTLDGRYCYVDAWAFERLLGEADALKNRGLTDSSAVLTAKAFTIYKGLFLAGENEELWMTPYRERLRSKFLRNVKWLGKHYEHNGESEKALECCKRGLEVDATAEEFYQCLMHSYQRLGRRADALSIYNRCRRTLNTTVGVDPSPETEAIKAEIMKG